ncbi:MULTISPECIES: hypothetical protein [unclassified Rhodococcus (in: high G+C Gram-positive bacteria)]|uniref:hypothetical protein n=1 Tax=unclassified Rhodococcus (in: high G+C Gram-positive bacteria) TaxID=192944 RepID=UPI003393F8F7
MTAERAVIRCAWCDGWVSDTPAHLEPSWPVYHDECRPVGVNGWTAAAADAAGPARPRQ